MFKKIIFILASVLFLLVICWVGFFIFFKDKIYPQTFLAGVNLSGRTVKEAKNLVDDSFAAFISQKMKFQYGERNWEIPVADFNLELNTEKNIEEVFSWSKKKNILCFLDPCHYALQIFLPEEKFKEVVQSNFQPLEEEVKEAQIILENQNVSIIPQVRGLKIDQAALEKLTTERISQFNSSPILVPVNYTEPKTTSEDLIAAKQEVEKMLGSKLTLTYQGKVWEISNLIFSDWIVFQPDGSGLIRPVLSTEQVQNYLQENIASEIEIEPKNALFKVEDGKITAFQLGTNGKKIDYEQTIPAIENYLKKSQSDSKGVEIAVKEALAEVNSQNADELGLKTLLGTGESDFAGSPANRIHNIKLGASQFNGALVKPNEEFSFNAIIGDVDERSGYKPELVIKPDGIKPEYGGGLCQVATTAFRAMLNAGVPITQRENHSLLVSYYKPYGMDATTYPGVHDVKFINDTPAYILIQTRIEGTKLYFDFFGTDDERKVEVTQPQFVSAFIDPGPPKEIPTDSLKKGEKQKVGNAFRGVSTVFYRTVTYTNGEEKKDKFFSKYKPWKAVYLVGTK